MSLIGFGKQQLPSVIQDPFSKNKISSITVRFWDMWNRNEWTAYDRMATARKTAEEGYEQFKKHNKL